MTGYQLAMRILVCVLSATAVEAQTIRGRVVAADSSAPVAGAVVVARRDDGIVVRTLTDSRGQFRVLVPSVGKYSISVLRIGFRPTEPTRLIVPSEGVSALQLTVRFDPIALRAIDVRTERSCRLSPNSALFIAKLWSEARATLLSAQVAGESPELSARWMEYSQTRDSVGRYVLRQDIRTLTERTNHVFRSIGSAELDKTGYVVDSPSGTSFYAPDPEVLLSEAFAEGHCFFTERGAATQDSVALQFEPARTRRGRSDIEGVIWFRGSPLRLSSITFSYTAQPQVDAALAAGGYVRFGEIPSGPWIVTEWRAQLPLVTIQRQSVTAGELGRIERSRTRVRALEVAGGEIESVSQDGRLVAERRVRGFRIQLVSTDPEVSTSGVSVQLDGMRASAVSDSAGVAALSPLPSGTYAVTVSARVAKSLLSNQVHITTVIGDVPRIDSLVLPTAPEIARSMCPAKDYTLGTGALVGEVRKADGTVAAAARIQVQFDRLDKRALQSNVVVKRDTTIETVTDAAGRWRMCGFPRETPFVTKASLAGMSGRAQGRIPIARDFHEVLITLQSEPEDDQTDWWAVRSAGAQTKGAREPREPLRQHGSGRRLQ